MLTTIVYQSNSSDFLIFTLAFRTSLLSHPLLYNESNFLGHDSSLIFSVHLWLILCWKMIFIRNNPFCICSPGAPHSHLIHLLLIVSLHLPPHHLHLQIYTHPSILQPHSPSVAPPLEDTWKK